MSTRTLRLVTGLVVALSASMAQAAFVVDDFNTTNTYLVSDGSTGGGGVSSVTPIDNGNTVWGVSTTPHTGITRTIFAELISGDGVQTEVCSSCQAGHVVANAGTPASEGDYYFEWSGPSVDLSGYNKFQFDWGADQSGTDWYVEFEDDVGDIAISGIQFDLPSTPSGSLTHTASVALPAFPGTIGGGQGYGDVTRIKLVFEGVAALDGNIDNVSAVPEPSTYILFGAGLLGILGFARKKMKA